MGGVIEHASGDCLPKFSWLFPIILRKKKTLSFPERSSFLKVEITQSDFVHMQTN